MHTTTCKSTNENPGKALIYYFSGTGNARHSALWLEEEFNQAGLETTVENIATLRGKQVQTPEPDTLVGFCSPTHGFHFPEITRKFISRFPASSSGKAFVLNTRAGLRIGKVFVPGLSGLVHYASAIKLKMKGYQVVGLRPVDLPSNWLSLHPSVRNKGAERMYKRQEEKVRKFGRKLSAGESDYRALYDIVQDLLISPVALGYMLIGRFALAKTFIASHTCSNCGLCKNSCPVEAIKKIQGRMFWTYKCESCMQCLNQCPEKAIETAHGFVIGFFYLFMTFGMSFLLTQISGLFPAFDTKILKWPVISFLVESALLLPFLFLGYRIMHWLMQFRFFERLVVWTSFTHYRFWGRYTFGLKKGSGINKLVD